VRVAASLLPLAREPLFHIYGGLHMKRIFLLLVFAVLVSALVSAGDLLTIETTVAEMSYDSSLDYLLKNGTNPTITRGYTYNVYFSELQQLKLISAVGNGVLEVYEMFNDQQTKMFGFGVFSLFTGVYTIYIYFDYGIPEEMVSRIGKPVTYKDYTPVAPQPQSRRKKVDRAEE
jgi:hypothetical protein